MKKIVQRVIMIQDEFFFSIMLEIPGHRNSYTSSHTHARTPTKHGLTSQGAQGTTTCLGFEAQHHG